jgi:hypothetical protein
MELYEPPASSELRPVYFSAVDGGIEHLVSTNSELFMRSLIYNLFFQEGGLVVPDVFFFNCEPLIRHVQSKDSPIFTRALERGLIIPAFRDERTESFRSALGSVSGAQIRGIEQSQFRQQSTNPEAFARKLDNAIQRGHRRMSASALRPRRIVWPDDMGGTFATTLRQTLRQDNLTNPYYERHHELWEETLDWRFDMVDEAERVTALMGGTGIRRAEIFNVVGRRLGYLGRSDAFDKPRDLVAAAEGDRAQSQRLSFFVDAINATYQRSQAEAFGAITNTLSPLTPVAASILPANDQPVDVNAVPTQPMTVNVRLPKISDILRAQSSEILAVRDGDEGDRFFDARREWMEHRTDSDMVESHLRSELADATSHYAQAICRAVGGPSHPFAVAAFASGGGLGLTEVIKSNVDFFVEQGDLHPTALLAAGTVIGSAIYFMAYGNRRRVQIEMKHPVPEMNI